jgi:hypothetical protein
VSRDGLLTRGRIYERTRRTARADELVSRHSLHLGSSERAVGGSRCGVSGSAGATADDQSRSSARSGHRQGCGRALADREELDAKARRQEQFIGSLEIRETVVHLPAQDLPVGRPRRLGSAARADQRTSPSSTSSVTASPSRRSPRSAYAGDQTAFQIASAGIPGRRARHRPELGEGGRSSLRQSGRSPGRRRRSLRRRESEAGRARVRTQRRRTRSNPKTPHALAGRRTELAPSVPLASGPSPTRRRRCATH